MQNKPNHRHVQCKGVDRAENLKWHTASLCHNPSGNFMGGCGFRQLVGRDDPALTSRKIKKIASVEGAKTLQALMICLTVWEKRNLNTHEMLLKRSC